MQSPLDSRIIRAMFAVADTSPNSEERTAINSAAEELFPGSVSALESAISFAKRNHDTKNSYIFTGALMMLFAITKIEKGG